MSAPILVIGGVATPLPPITFSMVRAIIPTLTSMRKEDSDIDAMGKMVAILAVFLGATAEQLEQSATYVELIKIMRDQWADVMRWTGLVPADAPGEATATSSPPSASTI
jgi:hypothetical protein